VKNPYVTSTSESAHPRDIEYIRTNIPCQWACPALTNVPAYILADYEGDYGRSYVINRSSNLFPGILGRICSRPCEKACRHGESDLGEPVGICHLKRVAGDMKPRGYQLREETFGLTGKTVGIVGAGPAGLAAAHSLALFGHRVTVYEALAKPGGMLHYGIPTFRLPRTVLDEEIPYVLRRGIEMITGARLGTDYTVAELLGRHDAVLLAMGCYQPNRLQVPGEDLPGVHSGLDFMLQVNNGSPPKIGKRVAVIGGGFTGMDCARSSLRLGAEDVRIHTLETEEDLTVTKEEVLETKREGVKLVSLVTTVGILGKERAEGLRLVRNRFGTAGEGGRRIPVPIEGSDFEVAADMVIVAIGQRPEKSPAAIGLDHEPEFDRETGACAIPGLYAVGDYARGASTVIEAVAHGRRVAALVDAQLMGRRRREKVVTIEPAEDTRRRRAWDFIPRTHMPTLQLAERLDPPDAEVETGYDQELGRTESQRCYLCNLKYEIYIPDCIYCRWCMDVCPRDCIDLATAIDPSRGVHTATIRWTKQWNQVAAVVIDSDRCIRCGECLRICPTRCIHVTEVNLSEGLMPQKEPGHGE